MIEECPYNKEAELEEERAEVLVDRVEVLGVGPGCRGREQRRAAGGGRIEVHVGALVLSLALLEADLVMLPARDKAPMAVAKSRVMGAIRAPALDG